MQVKLMIMFYLCEMLLFMKDVLREKKHMIKSNLLVLCLEYDAQNIVSAFLSLCYYFEKTISEVLASLQNFYIASKCLLIILRERERRM